MERVPCDPEFKNTDRCDVFRATGECFEDLHHLCYPRKAFKGQPHKEFRNLEQNKVMECRNMHNIEHAIKPVADIPSVEAMHEAITLERTRRRESPST